ncbi:MAG: hypothetical protein R3202_03745 [Candidatus Competibacterales bacterium]|nr:hypothetical protein [Candidatus Competibacterales bacterium]
MKRRLAWVLWTLALISLVALLWQAREAWLTARYNAALAAGDYATAGSLLLAEARFARAYALQRQGETQAALTAYHGLSLETGPLAAAARYNMANLYLREALALDAESQRDLQLPLAELAKTTYRELLRHNSDDWDARYNLARALRLVPDPRPREDAGFQAPERGPRAVITIQTDPQGLP